MSSVTTQHNITADAAHQMVAAAVAKAEGLGIRINVSVCDMAGLEMAFLRMNGAFIHSIDIAKDKAYTSASFGFPSAGWQGIFKSEPELEMGFNNRDRLVTFGGGLPIMVDDQVVGGIGVSGGSAEQDELCAQAGLDTL